MMATALIAGKGTGKPAMKGAANAVISFLLAPGTASSWSVTEEQVNEGWRLETKLAGVVEDEGRGAKGDKTTTVAKQAPCFATLTGIVATCPFRRSGQCTTSHWPLPTP